MLPFREAIKVLEGEDETRAIIIVSANICTGRAIAKVLNTCAGHIYRVNQADTYQELLEIIRDEIYAYADPASIVLIPDDGYKPASLITIVRN